MDVRRGTPARPGRGRRPGLALLPLAVLPLAIGLAGCDDILGADDVLRYEIGEAQVPCWGAFFPRSCYLYREGPDREWRTLSDGIEGFDYEPGYRYVIRVFRTTISNPPADASSHEYRLDRVESKVPSPRADLLAEARAAEERWLEAAPAAYVMVLERICFCTEDARGPVRLEVVRPPGMDPSHEEVVRRQYVDDGRSVPASLAHLFPSVWWLFGDLRHAVVKDAAHILVEFDDALGYPRRLFVDWDAAIADEEVDYVVHSLDEA